MQSKPNNYLVLIRPPCALYKPEHKVQSLVLQVQAGRIPSQDQQAHGELLEVDETVLIIRLKSKNVSDDVKLKYIYEKNKNIFQKYGGNL